jgi:predicted GIY-YIG superfamily endonuclease
VTCYLVCLDQPLGSAHPLGTAQHYLGTTINLDQRIQIHREGRGARILAAAVQRNIGFEVVRTWPGGRDRERQLKALHNPRRLCPRHG